MTFLPSTLDFLKSLGFEFALDYDDELIISSPEWIDPKQIAGAFATDYREATVTQLRINRERALEQFVGGPLSGRHCGLMFGPRAISVKRYRLPFEGGAHWCAYFVKIDGRAIFCGMTTSEKKARTLAASSDLAKMK